MFVLLLLLIVSACSSKEYDSFIQSGNEAVKEEKYEYALDLFQKAAEDKNSEEVQQSITFTSYMIDSLDFFKQGEFSDAALTIGKITKAKEESELIELLKPKALKLQQEATTLTEKYENLSNEYARGKTLLEQNQFDEAYNKFKSVSEYESLHPRMEEISKEATDWMNKSLERKNIFMAEQKANEEAKAAKKAEEERRAAEKKKQEQLVKTEEIFNFLKAASLKQHNYNATYPSKAAIQDELSSHFTREFSRFFIDNMYWEHNGVWEVLATDYLIGYVPDFSYNSNTKVQYKGNEIIVSEFVPAVDEGPVTWDAHTETVTISNSADGMIITNINGYLD